MQLPSIATTTTAAIAAAAVATATAAATTAVTAAAATGFFFLCYGNRDRTTFDLLVVKPQHGIFAFFFGRHFHKTKSARSAADLIHDHFGGAYCAKFFEKVSEIIISGVKA